MKRTPFLSLLSTAVLALLITTACKEKIDLKLKSNEPVIVIEGNVNDQAGPYKVLVSQSKPYYGDNNFTAVQSASVVISDDAGNTDSLTEVKPGEYHTNTLVGTAGRTYRLSVKTEGRQYDAVSKMNNPVTIDTAWIQELSFFGRSGKVVIATFKDPANEVNFYRLQAFRNGIKKNNFRISNDKITNGKQKELNITPEGDINKGDTIQLDLQSIDEPIWTYYNTLNNSANSTQTAAPANPESNLTYPALGYFSAYSVRSKIIYAP